MGTVTKITVYVLFKYDYLVAFIWVQKNKLQDCIAAYWRLRILPTLISSWLLSLIFAKWILQFFSLFIYLRYNEVKMTEEICPNCSKKFQCFSKGFLSTHMVCCKIYLMAAHFATIFKNMSLIRCWNGPNLLGLCMDVDLSVTGIFCFG